MTIPNDMLQFEKACWAHGMTHVAGVDEAGRGPLAGPVVVAGAVFPQGFLMEGVTDSKQLTADLREEFFDQIQGHALCFHIEIISNEDIDRYNILQASLMGMRACVEKMSLKVDYVLVDGNHEPFPRPHHYGSRQKAIIKGDALSFTIAAASILAKVTRDRLMVEYDRVFPQYQFAKHKGYPTPEHTEALRAYGMCTIHRRTFCAGILTEQFGLDL